MQSVEPSVRSSVAGINRDESARRQQWAHLQREDGETERKTERTWAKKQNKTKTSKYVSKNKGGHDGDFDSWGCLRWCVLRFVFTALLVQLPCLQINLMLEQSTLSEALGMIQHIILCYLLTPIFWTSCISWEMAVALATIRKHIIWTMSWFHFIIVMRPVLT